MILVLPWHMVAISFRRHRLHFGTEGVWGTFDATGLMIKKPQVVVHKAHQPDLLRDLHNADVLSGEHLAEIDLTPPDADATTGCDGDGAIVERVLQISAARGLNDKIFADSFAVG
jgi:hypothetical protein